MRAQSPQNNDVDGEWNIDDSDEEQQAQLDRVPQAHRNMNMNQAQAPQRNIQVRLNEHNRRNNQSQVDEGQMMAQQFEGLLLQLQGVSQRLGQ